ncbi:MAG TPA: thiamine pyrophosphate-dependent enzyme [Terriglobales bacterium]|nr:thiamine pyrophosphate-dependent enzyme [Terriglobales bacterium]
MTAGDVLVECLLEWGVEVVFGLPGDGINGIIEAFRARKDKIRFILVRHEEAAAFMACGYAKYTGKLGVCVATSGPGGIHLLNGLYDAKMDGASVLAITGLQYHDLIGTFTQQDVELDKLYADVCVYNQRIMGPTHVQNVMNLACRTALAYHGVAHVTMPVDFQEIDVKDWKRSKRNIPHHTSAVRAHAMKIPALSELQRAADILNEGKKVAILAGRGALHATDELEQVADILAGPIIKPLLGKAAVPDDSPYTTGPIGLLGTKPSQEAIEDCDTIFMVGTSFPYLEFMPKPDQAQSVQIDSDPKRIGLRYPVEVGLMGDSQIVLQNLIPLLTRKEDRSFLEAAQAGMKDWWQLMEKQATRNDKPMKPQLVAWELGKRLRDDAIVSCDCGTVATWWARLIRARRGQMFSISGTLASMANGMPYTIAAQVAYPDRQCVAFVGDGGFSMLMAEFVTAVKYKLPIKVVIVDNRSLGMIKWEQMVFLGNPEYVIDNAPIDFAEFAHACGGVGFSVDDPANCGETMDAFLNAPGPAILRAVVDPFEPPMPAKIKPEQALHFAESLARGEPNRKKIILTILADKVKEMV